MAFLGPGAAQGRAERLPGPRLPRRRSSSSNFVASSVSTTIVVGSPDVADLGASDRLLVGDDRPHIHCCLRQFGTQRCARRSATSPACRRLRWCAWAPSDTSSCTASTTSRRRGGEFASSDRTPSSIAVRRSRESPGSGDALSPALAATLAVVRPGALLMLDTLRAQMGLS